MKELVVKFFQWRLNIKIKNLAEEEKSKILLNELVKSLYKSGNLEIRPSGFGSSSLWIFNAREDNAEIRIENTVQANPYNISIKPTFKF